MGHIVVTSCTRFRIRLSARVPVAVARVDHLRLLRRFPPIIRKSSRAPTSWRHSLKRTRASLFHLRCRNLETRGQTRSRLNCLKFRHSNRRLGDLNFEIGNRKPDSCKALAIHDTDNRYCTSRKKRILPSPQVLPKPMNKTKRHSGPPRSDRKADLPPPQA